MKLKQQIKDELIKSIEEDIGKAKNAYQSSSELSTSSEFKQESKYDTRSIEAGYLAGAQKARIEELEQELNILKQLDISNQDQKIARIGSLLSLETNSTKSTYFISPISGGRILDIDNIKVMVISVFSPLGNECLGLSEGESFEVTTPRSIKEYEILSLS